MTSAAEELSTVYTGCGTETGYQRHVKLWHERACARCLKAHSAHNVKAHRAKVVPPPAAAPVDDGWFAQAICRGTDPELFHPQRGDGLTQDMDKAKAVCAGCPVRSECLEWALVHHEKFGVWGGLSERQRRSVRDRRRKKALLEMQGAS